MTPEQSEVLRAAGNWFDGRDGSHQELTNAVLALRRAEAIVAEKKNPHALVGTYNRLSQAAPDMTTEAKILHIAKCMDLSAIEVSLALLDAKEPTP